MSLNSYGSEADSETDTSEVRLGPQNTDNNMLAKLCDIINQLSSKIDVLEDKIDVLTSHVLKNSGSGFSAQNVRGGVKKNLIYTPDYIPSHDFDAWTQTCTIKQEHVNAIFRNTILEGFKSFIHDWFSEQQQSGINLPIVVLGSGKTKMLYVFEMFSEDDFSNLQQEFNNENIVEPLENNFGDKNGKWVLISEQAIQQFIASIWRKMLEYYFTSENEPGVDETIRDINKKKLIDMRKGLVEKHLREIERTMVKVLQK